MVIGQSVIAAAVAVGAVQVLAQDEPAVDSRATVENNFLYQGRLELDGVPVSGQCSMEFRIFDAAAGGVQVGSTQTTGVAVQEGVFSVLVGAGSSIAPSFDGNARWLETSADCGSGQVSLGRQALSATPYALSIRPGAKSKGNTSQAILEVTNDSLSGEGFAATAQTAFLSTLSEVGVKVVFPQDDGVLVQSATGDGVDAESSNVSAFGGRFTNSATNGPGLFARGGGGGTTADIVLGSSTGQNTGRISTEQQAGADLALRSYDQVYVELVATGETGNFIIKNETTEVFEIRDTGDIRQANDAFGIPKLAMRILCSDTNSDIQNFESSLKGVLAPTITNGAVAGDCTIDINFSTAGRYVVATPIATEPRTATVITSGETISITRTTLDGIGTNGNVYVVVY